MFSGDSAKLYYHCRSCDLSFHDEESCMRHIDAEGHSYCKTCNMVFDSDGALFGHIGEEFHYRPEIYCKACDTSFRDERAKYNHKHCDICKESFVDRVALEDHTSLEHPIRYSFVSCTSCHDSFRDRDALAQHLVEVHRIITTNSEPAPNQNWAFPSQWPSIFIDHKKSENKGMSLLGPGNMGISQYLPNQLVDTSQLYTYNNGQLSLDERIAAAQSDTYKYSEQPWDPQVIGLQPFMFNNFQLLMDQATFAAHPGTSIDSQQSLYSQVTTLQPWISSDKQGPLKRPVAVNGSFYHRSDGVWEEKRLAIDSAAMGNGQPQGAGPMEGVEIENIGKKRKSRERLINCTKCTKTLRNQDGLDQHMYKVHSLGFSNKKRGRKFHSKRGLSIHGHVPQNHTILFCCDCGGQSFKDHKALREHSMTFHPLKFPCNQCGINFEGAGGLSNHMDTHKAAPVKELLFCLPCGALFATIEGLQKHLGRDIHKKDSPIINCIIGGARCGKFLSLSQLVVHWETGRCVRVFDRNQIVQILTEYDTGKKEAVGLPIRKRQRVQET